MKGIYWCRVVPITMLAKRTYKTSYSNHVGHNITQQCGSLEYNNGMLGIQSEIESL